MRLINTATLQFEEHDSDRLSYRYAILSHRWGENEISYQDYLKGKQHIKIKEFCRLARNNGCMLAWVDTCCIDKRSSAELSEAINSMYNWYEWSSFCYVYLVDVPSTLEADEDIRMKAFRESQWWARGWTLQELLAPENVEFYDCGWNKLGTKSDLLEVIAEVTGIAFVYLRDPFAIPGASVATRMSWASRRSTTRAEDIAYSLMGIFDVNMPLLYGEGGTKAYLRLQQEIIKNTDDDSIFAWKGFYALKSSMLAPEPYCFAKSRHVSRINNLQTPRWKQKPYSMTNRGLKIRFPSCPAEQGCRYVLLHCCAGQTCERCRLPPSRERTKIPNPPEIHQWLAVKLEPFLDGLWTRSSSELYIMDPQQFDMDGEAIYVV